MVMTGSFRFAALALCAFAALFGAEAQLSELLWTAETRNQIFESLTDVAAAAAHSFIAHAEEIAEALGVSVGDSSDSEGNAGRDSVPANASVDSTTRHLDVTSGATTLPRVETLPPLGPLQGVAYGPLPCPDQTCGHHGLPSKDTAQAGFEAKWGRQGRDDLAVVQSLGSNAVQLYDTLGSRSLEDHGALLDHAQSLGINVLPGYHTEMSLEADKCVELNCFDAWKGATLKGFRLGFLKNDEWHPAVAALMLFNEPDFLENSDKCQNLQPEFTGAQCRVKAVLSAFDGVLAAEKAAGVGAGRVKLTASWSFAMRTSIDGKIFGPGIFGFQDMVAAMEDPNIVGYTPKTPMAELREAFKARWVHSLNTQAPWKFVRDMISKEDYAQFLPTPWFVGEYGALNQPAHAITQGLHSMKEAAMDDEGFLGVVFHKFQEAHGKHGSEANFGLLGKDRSTSGADLQSATDKKVDWTKFATWPWSSWIWLRVIAGSMAFALLATVVPRTMGKRSVDATPSATPTRWFTQRVDLPRKYDVVLKLESLAAFAKSGRIETMQAAETLFDMAKEEQCRIIAFVGLFDKGKTFLINRLFDISLPSGSGVVTKGLSFFWVKERSMLILDSAGVQAPVKYDEASASNLGVETIADAQNTETLIFDLISRLAHHVVFVVDNLTWAEQKYIQMLNNKYIQREKKRQLSVVHNLRSVDAIDVARRLWKEQVLRNYEGGRSSHLAELVYTENRGEDVPTIHHYGMCANGSEAGRCFNDNTCKHLLQALEMQEMIGSKVVLKDALVRELRELMPLFFKSELSPGDVDQEEPRAAWHVEYKPGEGSQDDEGYVVAGAVEFRTESGSLVLPRNEGHISPLGDIITFDSKFDPPVYVYDDAGANPRRRYIEIECPGVVWEDIAYDMIGNGVRLDIEKRKTIDESRVVARRPLRQKSGRWQRAFAYEDAQGTWEACGMEEMTLESGVFRMFLREKPRQRHRLGGAPLVAAAAAAGATVRRTSSGFDAVSREPDPEVSSSPDPAVGMNRCSANGTAGAGA